MGSSDKFCLRWNDFESNISLAFRELRDDSDFFDVTLASEDDRQIQAHKVILSACSPFFRKVLKRNPHTSPLLYLKGVRHTDLVSILNFMYHGEDELNSFLAVAEELSVKGLTTSTSGQSSSSRGRTGSAAAAASSAATTKPRLSRTSAMAAAASLSTPPAKRPRTARTSTAAASATTTVRDDGDEGEGVEGKETVAIKTEPRGGGGVQGDGGEGGGGGGEEDGEGLDQSYNVDPDNFDYEGEYDDDADFAGEEGEQDMDHSASAGTSDGSKEPNSKNSSGNKKMARRSRPYELLEHGTVHNTPVYICDGYGYTKDRERQGKVYVRCRARIGTKCRGRANLDLATQDFVVTMPHTCDLQTGAAAAVPENESE